MARLRRLRTSSQTSSRSPDLPYQHDSADSQLNSSPSISTRPRSLSNAQTPFDQTGAGRMVASESTPAPSSTLMSNSDQRATIRFFPHQDSHRNSRPSLDFVPVSRTLPPGSFVIRVGRYSERDGIPVASPAGPSGAPVGFRSKVVSRKHCEFVYSNAQWHVKDVGSSSGTFLNHMRLSQPNMVSRLFPIKDGDIVQLGIDFRGGEEMIFRCVRMRIECNRSWQQQPNEFNKNTKSLIKNLGKGDAAEYTGCHECSICLGSVLRPYQCLFIAACAHVWHYKCVSPLIHSPEYPMFQCPNCRAYTDLSAEIDDANDFEEQNELRDKPYISSRGEDVHEQPTDLGTSETGEEALNVESARSQLGQEAQEPGSETPGPTVYESQPEAEPLQATRGGPGDSEEGALTRAAPLPHPSFTGLQLPVSHLSGQSLGEALAINFNDLGLGDGVTRTAEVQGDLSAPQHGLKSRDTADSMCLAATELPSASSSAGTARICRPEPDLNTHSCQGSCEENPQTTGSVSEPLFLEGRAEIR